MHPKREKYREYFEKELPEAQIIMDRGRGVWDTAKRAWLTYDPKKKFHTVIQDDALLCSGFKRKVERLLEKHQDKYAYSYFIRRRRKSVQPDIDWEKVIEQGYLIWNKLGWAQGVTIPTKYIKNMVELCSEWFDNKPKYRDKDDTRMSHYFKRRKIKVYHPIPCLIQHRGEEDSLIGLGHNSDRQAAAFNG